MKWIAKKAAQGRKNLTQSVGIIACCIGFVCCLAIGLLKDDIVFIVIALLCIVAAFVLDQTKPQ